MAIGKYIKNFLAILTWIIIIESTNAFKISGLDELFKRARVAYIIGGEDAEVGKWSWQAALQFKDPFTGHYDPVCGGALIAPEWIVTATHCVDNTYGASRTDPTLYKVTLGAYDLKNPTGTEIIITPSRFFTHPDFELDMQKGFPNDIALVRLSEPVDVAGSGLQTILLSTADDDFQNADCYITGWGITQAGDPSSYPGKLQQAVAYVISNQDCQSQIAMADTAPILDTQVCVGGDHHATACTGDSGSPLSCYVNGQWKLAGIYSWYVTCSGLPSVYTRMSSYLDWIAETMAR